MVKQSSFRRYLPYFYWIAGLFVLYFILNFFILPNASGITLTPKIIADRLGQIGGLLLGILIGMAVLEFYVYQLFFRQPRNPASGVAVRVLQGVLGILALLGLLAFFEKTDLYRMGDDVVASVIRFPVTMFASLQKSLVSSDVVGKSGAVLTSGLILTLILAAFFVAIHLLTVPRHSKLGLAYLLVLPALLAGYRLGPAEIARLGYGGLLQAHD